MTPFKEIFNASALDWLTHTIGATWPNYQHNALAEKVLPQLPNLEFKARIDAYANGLLHTAPLSLDALAQHLPALLGDIPPAGDGTHFGDFRWAILLRVVSLLAQQDPQTALNCFAQLTLQFSAEFDVRYCLQADLSASLAVCHTWAKSPDWRLRRLASEGTRPRLPWGLRLHTLVKDPSPCLPILEALRFDPILAVRRSVANHLNDISKDHPAIVLALLQRWQTEGVDGYLIRHALRGLLKAGYLEALALCGAHVDFVVSDVALALPAQVHIGTDCTFNYQLTAQTQSLLMIDYALTIPGKTRPRTKVYKGIKRQVQIGDKLDVQASVSFKPVTVRAYYAGKAQLALIINGKQVQEADFVLLD